MTAAKRLEFRILGPLTVRVNGAAVALGGPKQRALLALLLLSANRVVSRDRLVAELFAEQSVASAEHALRNQIWRVRRMLTLAAKSEPRLLARTPGYLLRVEPGELDLERFERLVADGRESLADGDPATAAASFGAAEALWEGRPLADLEFEPFARFEVERLEELRLAAVEERVDAELALGKQLALVPELEALAVEHPFRERFRAQLMLALYRCGRQADGLEVYRRTRVLMNDELGLEPAVELQELERAILVQDPALTISVDGAGRSAVPLREVCPFKGLAPFEAGDAEFFFGRERLLEELVARVAEAPFLALVGASGSGKSSLLSAGLLPALEQESLVVRPGDHPGAELLDMVARVRPGQRLVLAVDQFEEVFAASVTEQERATFIEALVEAAWDPERRVLVVIALRADFFDRLAPYIELADLIAQSSVLLGPMSQTELRRAIEGPGERVGLEVEPALVDALVDEVAGEVGALPLLSTVLLDLWQTREDRSLTLSAHERAGGIRGAVGRHAEAAFQSLDEEGQQVARRIFLRLVAGGEGEPLTRRRVTRDELDADEDEAVTTVLAALVERRLLVANDGSVELVHEALLEQWPRLARWLQEDVQGRLLHRHLTEAAGEWEAGGREPDELYRGARLAAALDWADDAALNRVEREFLEESRTAFSRANRRLRILLALALLLLAAALGAGAIALTARASARHQATAAIAERLGSQALVASSLDRALLLARQAVALDDSSATRSDLLAALLRSPAALAVLHGRDPELLDETLSGDGRLLAVGGSNGTVSIFATRTLREPGARFGSDGQIALCGAIVRPVRALAFSPDGRTLAIGDWNGNFADLYLVDRRTQVERALSGFDSGPTADIVYAPDGRTLVTGEVASCRSHPPPEQLTLRRASDGAALRRSPMFPGGRLIGFSKGGRFLLVTSGESRSYLLDPRTLARVRTFHLAGSAALSPVAETAAFGQDDGSVKLLNLRTGAVRAMDRRATGTVTGVGFSRDGKVLATTSDDGTVDVWDVPTASLRETFTGQAGATVGPVFSPDGTTLYTASDDGSVIVWDVRGERRLGRPFRFSPVARSGEGSHARVHRAASAVAVSADSSLFATSPAPDRVTLWRTRDLAVLAELRGPCGSVQSLAFSHDGRLLAAGGSRRAVVWDLHTRAIGKLFAPAGESSVNGVGFSPDDRLLGTAGDGFIRLYDLRSGHRLVDLTVQGTEQDIDFSPDGAHVAAAGLAGNISIVNLRSRTIERTITTPADAIYAIRYSPDGRQLASVVTGSVDFWDPATGRASGRTLGAQNSGPLSVAYSPRGDQVVTTGADGKLRLWDRATGKLVGAPLPAFAPNVASQGAFFPNARYVIATSESGTGVIWNVDPNAWREQACRIANRNLTRTEWHDFLPERAYHPACQ